MPEKSDTDISIKRERIFVQIFLFVVCLTFAHFVHNAWRLVWLFPTSPATLSTNARAVDVRHAPDAYRVMMPWLMSLCAKVISATDMTWVVAASDGIFGYAALSLMYRLTVRDFGIEPDKRWLRLLVTALFLAIVQLPVNWIVPWQRPETLPTAFFIAAALFCLSQGRRRLTWTFLLLAATLFQAFVRADVPFVFGAALFLMSFAGDTLREFGSRPANAGRGAAIVMIAGGVQGYMQFIKYPHLTYTPGTAVIQIWENLKEHNLTMAGLALLPFLLSLAVLIKMRTRLNSIEAMALAASALYLPVWFTVGIVGEVRIFVPFLFALSIVAARTLGVWLAGCALRDA